MLVVGFDVPFTVIVTSMVFEAAAAMGPMLFHSSEPAPTEFGAVVAET